MAFSVVQHTSGIEGNGTPGSISLGSAPTSGNLLIAFLHLNIQLQGTTINLNTAAWTDFIDVNTGTGITAFQEAYAFYRYVQPGDTAALPAFITSLTGTQTSTYWAYEVYELSGATGTWLNDYQQSNFAVTPPSTNVTSLTTSTLTASAAGLALVGAAMYNGSANPSLSSGWTQDEVGNNATNYGSDIAGHQAFSASASIACTVSFTTNSSPAQVMVALFGTNPTISVTGVSATCDVGSPTFSNSGTLSGVSTVSAAGTVTPNSTTPSVVGASASGGAGALSVIIEVAPVGIAAMGSATETSGNNSTILGVSTTAEVGQVIAGPLLEGVFATGFAGITRGGGNPYFPVYSIMSNTPVATAGTMSNEPLAVVGRMLPSGPQPFSVEVFAESVSASGTTISLWPSRNIQINAAAVSASALANVVATD